MRDLLVVASVLLGFAVLVTVHLAIVLGLATKPPRWKALLALIVVPLAPYYALAQGMRMRGLLWLVASAVYALSLVLALRGG